MADDKGKKDSVIEEALERWDEADSAWSPVLNDGLADARFALLGEQWPVEIENERLRNGRPTLTLNHMPKFIRQVTNDARQNKPQVVIRPMDSGADIDTAEVFSGIVKQIESQSDADVAYDTGVFGAVTQGIGYWRIDIDHTCDDSFDYDIKIGRINNPMSVRFDPFSQAADASDWRYAFVYEDLDRKEFEAEHPGADTSSFPSGGQYDTWMTKDVIRRAEYWTREKIMRKIWLMSNGQVIGEDVLSRADVRAQLAAAGVSPTQNRDVPSYKITHRLMSGREELEKKEWAGSMIPIVPVFGEEFNIEGRRYFRSLIHHGKDAQRNFNYWRSTGTELIALAPKAPWVGPKGFIGTGKMAEKWGSANVESHAFLEYDLKGAGTPPQRNEFAGVPQGVLQEANLAGADMRDIIGISNPGLGVQQEFGESGRAIRMRRAESDTGTLHFHDNLMRAVRYSGRVIVELIPKVYNTKRVVRILGKDGTQSMVPVNQPFQMPATQSNPAREMNYDLTAGKYDVAVDTGPSYATQREEAAESMTAFVQAFPESAPILGDMIARNSDWPESAKVAKRLEALLPPAVKAAETGQQLPPPPPPPEVLAEQAKAQAARERAQVDAELQKQKFDQDAALADQAARHRQELEARQAEADIVVLNRKTDAEIAANDRKTASMMQLKKFEAILDAVSKIADREHAHGFAQQAQASAALMTPQE